MNARSAAMLLFLSLMILIIVLISCESDCRKNCMTVCKMRECEEYCSQWPDAHQDGSNPRAICRRGCLQWGSHDCTNQCNRDCR